MEGVLFKIINFFLKENKREEKGWGGVGSRIQK